MEEEETESRPVRRKNNGFKVLLVLMLVTLIAVLIFVLLLELDRQRQNKLQPVYRYVSLSEEAAARAYIWLDKIEDMPLSYAEIRQRMGDIQLKIVLTPTGEKGKYTQALADGAFVHCSHQAKSGLEAAYREVVRYRLQEAGYEDEITDEGLDDMMREIYGVSVTEYLEKCRVKLLPELEELREQYSGEVMHE